MPAGRRPKATAINRKGPYNDSEQPRRPQLESNSRSLEDLSGAVHNGQELPSKSLENNEARNPPEQYSEYSACPFAKHCPSRYHHINNACTIPRGFKVIGKLKFQDAKKETIMEIRTTHQNTSGECTAREFTRNDPEWLTDEQEVRFMAWEEQASRNGSASDKWQRIYQSIFGDEGQLPSPLSADPADMSLNPAQSKLALHSVALHSEILAENEKQYDYGFEYVVYKVPTVSQNEHFNVPDSYTDYLEDQDQDLLLVENDSVYFDDAMPGSANDRQDGLNETEAWEDTVDNFSCMAEGNIG
ncbi:hypothetical protein IFR05_013190 [Cadophora sp. M221]|nr:hypothetical protein IFR05_013190 [Cadophora sp. M221]